MLRSKDVKFFRYKVELDFNKQGLQNVIGFLGILKHMKLIQIPLLKSRIRTQEISY